MNPGKNKQPSSGFAAGVIPSGSLRLDIALQTGGIPRGRICELYGPVSSGKTTLCQHIIAESQRTGDICAFIDSDKTLDVRYAKACGVDLDRLVVSAPEQAEQAIEITESLVRSGVFSLVVIDSVSALITRPEIEAALGETHQETADHQLSYMIQKLSPILTRNHTTLILTNKSSARMSSVYHKLKDNPARLAIKLNASTRLKMTPQDHIYRAGEIIGQRCQVRIVKNILTTLNDSIELVIIYREGIRKTGEILDLGKEIKIVNQQKTIYSYRGQSLGSGRDNAIKTLRQNPQLAEEIEQVIRHKTLPKW